MTTLPSSPSLADPAVETLLDERTQLQDALQERLEPPSLDLLNVLGQAAQAIAEVDTRSLEMSNEETGEDNHSAVRSLERDTDAIASSVGEALSMAVDQTLVRPFQDALSAAKALGWGMDDWSPQSWIATMREPTVPAWAHRDLLSAILGVASVSDIPRWYELVQNSPGLHRWDAWVGALSAAAYRETVLNDVLDRLLADETVQRPVPPRGKPPITLPMDEVKRQGLATIAWNGLINMSGHGQEPLRRAIWARVPPVPEQLDWDRLVARTIDTASNDYYKGNDGLGAAPKHVDRLLAPFTELLATGALNGWLNRPEQWQPVDPSTIVSSPRTVPLPVTWLGMAATMESAGHVHLARRLQTLGESFNLQNAFATVTSDEALTAPRDRVRL